VISFIKVFSARFYESHPGILNLFHAHTQMDSSDLINVPQGCEHTKNHAWISHTLDNLHVDNWEYNVTEFDEQYS
jgi:hypothetical protein